MVRFEILGLDGEKMRARAKLPGGPPSACGNPDGEPQLRSFLEVEIVPRGTIDPKFIQDSAQVRPRRSEQSFILQLLNSCNS